MPSCVLILWSQWCNVTLITVQAENDYRSENSHPKRMSTPSPSYRANGYVAGATVNLDRGTGKGKAQFVKPSSSKSSRLVILEAQLRALDAI